MSSFKEITEGMRVNQVYKIDSDIYEKTLSAFSDHNPIHVDEGAARAQGFEGKVMHGMILNGFLSKFIGTCFPGPNSLELSVDIRYVKPTYLNDVILVEAEVEQKSESQRAVTLNVTFFNQTRDELAARSRAMVRVGSE